MSVDAPRPTLAETRAALAEARRAPAPRGHAVAALAAALGATTLPLGVMAALSTGLGPPLAAWLLVAPAALGQLALAVVVHACAHRHFVDRRLDGLLGALCGLVILMPFGAYRLGHAAHHDFVGTPRDPSPAPRDPRPSPLLTLLMHLRIVPVFYWGGVYGPYLIYALRPTAHRRRARHVARWAVEYGAALAGWAALALLAPEAGLLHAMAWVGAGVLYEHLFTFTQHLGLRPDRVADRYDLRSQTHFARTVRLPFAGALLHFNLHKEHHLAPGLAWQRLPALHRALAARRPDLYRFTDDRIRPWRRRRGPAHAILRATVGDRRP